MGATEIRPPAPGEPPDLDVEALELLAVVHFELDQLPEARQTFQELLSLDPAHELTDPAYPPRFREFFVATRGVFVPRIEVDVEVTAPEHLPAGGGGTVVLEAAPTGSTAGVDRAVAFVRIGSSGDFSQHDHLYVACRHPGGWRPSR